MNRVLILGGGVGGTIVANLLARRRSSQPDLQVTVVDQTGRHVYQPGFMYVAVGGDPPKPPKPGRLWHLGKIVFNKTYWHTVPKGRF